jgi:flagellar M-ring protein FliF
MDAFKQIRAWFLGLSKRQRLVLGGGAAAVLLILAGLTTLIGNSGYRTLYSGMSPADAQALGAKLEEKKIPFRLTPDGGGVQVPEEQLDKARLEVASQGLPASGRLGFELFDKTDWMGSDFAEKVNYQRALEGELERTIQTLSEVETARVHIVLPRESLFTDQEKEAKASIVLKLKRLPSRESEQAITQLVAGAVENLRPENVTIVDSNGQMLNSGQRRGGYPTDGDLEHGLTEKLLATLEPVVGREHVRASVNVEYDLANTEDQRDTYDPNSAIPLAVQKSEETSQDSLAAGVPGTASNVPGGKSQVPAGVGGANGSSQSNRTESSTYAVNHTMHHIQQSPGGIKRISAAVLLDASAGPRSPEQLQQITQLARAALDVDANRGDNIVVQSVAFTQAPAEAPVPPPTLAVRVNNIVQRWTALLRYGALAFLFLVVYFFVLRPVRKQFVTALKTLKAAPAQTPKLAVAAAAQETALPPTAEALLPGLAAAEPELRKQIVEKVKRDPTNASRLIQSWLRQPEPRK